MLVLKRKEGQWIEVTHKSGDVLRFRVYDIGSERGRPDGAGPAKVNIAFDDEARNFDIQRPERFFRAHPATSPAGPHQL